LLTGVDVSGAIFDRAALAGAIGAEDLQGATLRHVSTVEFAEILRLHQVWLDSRGTQGQRATLSECDLSGFDLRRTKLALAVLARAVLRGADLSEASLVMCDLSYADLREARLDRADMRGAKLVRAHIGGASLLYTNLAPLENVGDRKYDFPANLEGAKLGGADLRDALMKQAKLSHVDLSGANLDRADLRQADLCNANLRGATSAQALFEGASLREVRNLRHHDEPSGLSAGSAI
jgi:uncharacterized protein YjbI with pentapeptide repeats